MRKGTSKASTKGGRKLICQFCGNSFFNTSSLKRHVRNLHRRNEKGEEIPKLNYECPDCNKVFHRTDHLKFHMDHVHNPERDEQMCDKCGYRTKYSAHFKRHKLLHEKKEQQALLQIEKAFKCSKCDKQYDSRSGLRFHEHKFHKSMSQQHVVRKKSGFLRKCPLCMFTSSSVLTKEMLTHFEQRHQISMVWEKYKFANYNEFLVWKKEIEKKTSSFYAKKKAPEQKLKVFTYKCHRSGFFEGRKGKQRRMKAAGSCKINGFCPSVMKATLIPEGVEVVYLSTHVGHKNDLKFLPLTDEDKLSIVKQLKNDVPVNKILDDINKSLSSGEQMRRIHLLTPKDIINLTTQYKLKTTKDRRKIQQDSFNIDAYFEEIENSSDTSLLIYKGQGVVREEYPHLGEEDFVLIYMTSKQKSVLEKCIDNTLCVDSNHLFILRGSFDFHLFSILALNESRDGFPVAFMITNRHDEEVLATFFDEVKQIIGSINCKVLLTDLGDASYMTWQKTMGIPKSRVFCSWHVLRDWRENVDRCIQGNEKRELTFNKLQTLLREQNEDTVMSIVSCLLSLEQDEDIKPFIDYFNKEFLLKRQLTSWAFCSGKNAELNESMMCNDFFRSLKFSYLKARKNQSLEETVCTFLSIIRRKLHEFSIDIKLTKLQKKLLHANKGHRQSLRNAYNVVELEEESWIVTVLRGTTGKSCAVKRISSNCYNCQLQCLRCNTCVHEFICSCKNYSVDNNFCEHIHIVAQAIDVPSEVKEGPEEIIECDTVVMDFVESTLCGETVDNNSLQLLEMKEEEISSEVNVHWEIDDELILNENQTSGPLLHDEKNEFIEEINKFLSINVTSKEDFENFKKEVKNAMGSKVQESTSHSKDASLTLPFQVTPGRTAYILKIPHNTSTQQHMADKEM